MLDPNMLVQLQDTYLRTIGLPLNTRVQLELAPHDYRELMPQFTHYSTLLWPRYAIPRVQMVIANEGVYRFVVIEDNIDVRAATFIKGVMS